MTTIPPLRAADIRSMTDARTYQRGLQYYTESRVEAPQQQGNKLRARVQGSQLYQCEVTFDALAVESSYCSCPVGGNCKHVVALLLTWLHHPHQFSQVAEPRQLLQNRSPDELAALIVEMIDRYPDLETLLHLPKAQWTAAHEVSTDHGVAGHSSADHDTAKHNVPANGTVDPATIRQQLRAARKVDHFSSGNHRQVDDAKINQIIKLGEHYIASEDWRNAVAIYATVLEELLDSYEELADAEGYLLGFDPAVAGLQRALQSSCDPALRLAILRTLFTTYDWDAKHGGLGLSDELPDIFSCNATPQEKCTVANWVNEALTQNQHLDVNRQWRQQALGGFLLFLQGEALDDESYLRICRQSGRLADLAQRLLTRHRIEEAITVACAASDDDLLKLADIFEEHEQGALAERLLLDRVRSKPNPILLAWLKRHSWQRGAVLQATDLAQTLFWHNPTVDAYLELQAVAQPSEQWPQLAQAIEQRLQQENRWDLLARIHLHDHKIVEAIQCVRAGEEQGRQARHYWYPDNIRSARLAVATAAEEVDPLFALESYLLAAEHAINERSRNSYIIAAQYLQRAQRAQLRLSHGQQLANAPLADQPKELLVQPEGSRPLVDQADFASLRHSQ